MYGLFNKIMFRIKKILNDTKNIFIEAGTIQSWTQYMKTDDISIGLKTFGLSGPAKDVYEHFEITVDRVLSKQSFKYLIGEKIVKNWY